LRQWKGFEMNQVLAGRKVIITGGAGFIGHNLALALARLGVQVQVIDSLQVNNLNEFASDLNSVPNRDLYLRIILHRIALLHEAGIPVHVLDLRDHYAIANIIKTVKPEAIVHLAAVAHATKANKEPFSTFDHSLPTLQNTLDCARFFDTHFIYFSSSMVYGTFPDGFVTEESQCEPLGIYGALKFSGEKIVIAYNQVFDIPYTIVRPSALYGERCVSRRVGQIFIENALQGHELQVAGDGSDRLDFTYIDDVVNGVIAIIANQNARNEVFNMTYGSSRSVAQMIDILRAHVPGIAVKYVPRDRLTPDRGTLSMAKAKRVLGYEPEFPLEKGFPRYIEWYKSQLRSNRITLARAV
jgi:nucleoside-diphosphate-sugar epimerase